VQREFVSFGALVRLFFAELRVLETLLARLETVLEGAETSLMERVRFSILIRSRMWLGFRTDFN
jgi:hypothetical protein